MKNQTIDKPLQHQMFQLLINPVCKTKGLILKFN